MKLLHPTRADRLGQAAGEGGGGGGVMEQCLAPLLPSKTVVFCLFTRQLGPTLDIFTYAIESYPLVVDVGFVNGQLIHTLSKVA